MWGHSALRVNMSQRIGARSTLVFDMCWSFEHVHGYNIIITSNKHPSSVHQPRPCMHAGAPQLGTWYKNGVTAYSDTASISTHLLVKLRHWPPAIYCAYICTWYYSHRRGPPMGGISLMSVCWNIACPTRCHHWELFTEALAKIQSDLKHLL